MKPDVLTKLGSDYVIQGVYPYQQYSKNPSIVKFFECVNDEVNKFLNSFFLEFSQNIDINNPKADDYSHFYLINYYGLTPIPTPSSAKMLTAVQWDTDGLKFESRLPGKALELNYDMLITDDSALQPYLKNDTWNSLVRVLLNYKWEIYNIPFICELLKTYHKVETNTELDLRTIEIQPKPDEDCILIILPNEIHWENLILISEYSPNSLGLPFGKSVVFQLGGLEKLEIEVDSKVIRVVEGSTKEFEVRHTGDSLRFENVDTRFIEVKEKP